MDHEYPSDAAQSLQAHQAQKQAAFMASGAIGRAGYGSAGPVHLAKDMPLTAQLSESFSGQIQQLEVIGKTLAEAHMRVFGPLPPSQEAPGGAAVPQPDTVESHLLGASRGVTERLYALQHIANCISNRL